MTFASAPESWPAFLKNLPRLEDIPASKCRAPAFLYKIFPLAVNLNLFFAPL